MKSGRDKFERNRKVLSILISITRIFPKWFLIYIWDCITNHSQLLFIGMRYVILKALVKNCGKNVSIGTNVKILGWEGLSLGANISIHSNCYIDATGEIEIGNDVSIAHNSTILSSNHGWELEKIPIKYNPLYFSKVLIENDVWIGCGCRILAGVIIESRSIVAAGAVVNKKVASNSIVGGVPAKLIKNI